MTSAARAPLSRRRIVSAALELIDDHGVEALSMRKLGQRLGVEAMSLYNHVASKDDLLDAVASKLLELVDVGDPKRGDWREGATAIANRVRTVGLAHPRAFPLLASRKLSSLQSWAPIEGAFLHAQRAGLDDVESVALVGTFEAYIIGFVLLEIHVRALELEGRRMKLEDVPADQPILRRFLAARNTLGFDERFRRGIDLILDGVAQRVITPPPANPPTPSTPPSSVAESLRDVSPTTG